MGDRTKGFYKDFCGSAPPELGAGGFPKAGRLADRMFHECIAIRNLSYLVFHHYEI